MTGHDISQTAPGPTARRISGALIDRPLERLFALVHEWQARRRLELELGRMSDSYLCDIGLIRADLKAACGDSLGRSSARAIENTAQGHAGNW